MPLLTHSATAFTRQRHLSRTIPQIACLTFTLLCSPLLAGGQRHPSHPEQSHGLMVALRPPRPSRTPQFWNIPCQSTDVGAPSLCPKCCLQWPGWHVLILLPQWALPTTFPSLAYRAWLSPRAMSYGTADGPVPGVQPPPLAQELSSRSPGCAPEPVGHHTLAKVMRD